MTSSQHALLIHMCVGAECGRGEGEGDMIHPSRRETNQLCSDSGTVDLCVCVCVLLECRIYVL